MTNIDSILKSRDITLSVLLESVQVRKTEKQNQQDMERETERA